MSLQLSLADGEGLRWASSAVAEHHYLHKPPDPRSRPLCYLLHFAARPVGCLFFCRPESTRCYRGGLTYGSQDDVRDGRATYDRWEVLNLSRLWLSPAVQPYGELWRPNRFPGFTDRKGVWRSSLASWLIGQAMMRVGADYLAAHPPCFVDEPYIIRAVLSYCDTRLHRGIVYRAAGFRLARTNEAGIQTWWTPEVKELTAAQNLAIRERSAASLRCARIRERVKGGVA